MLYVWDMCACTGICMYVCVFMCVCVCVSCERENFWRDAYLNNFVDVFVFSLVSAHLGTGVIV